jgi:hypothetical protein
MIQINASAWGDWDEMIAYIRGLVSKGCKIQIINGSALLELWHGEELRELGFSLKTK